MSTIVMTKKGKTFTLLNPSEKSEKFANELKFGFAKTNTLKTKRDSKGKDIKLSDTQLAFRSGYLQARKDSAKAFKSKKRRK